MYILKYVYSVWRNWDGKEHFLNFRLLKNVDDKDITFYIASIIYIKWELQYEMRYVITTLSYKLCIVGRNVLKEILAWQWLKYTCQTV